MKNGWDNISIGEFVQIRAILGDSERNTEDKQIALAALIQGVSEDELLNMPLKEASEAFALANSLNTHPKRGKIRKQYQCGDWVLKVCEAGQMSVAQWVDFQTYGRDLEKHLVDILSVALVPEGKKYNEGYDMVALKQDLRDKMMIPDALAVCFFFHRRWLRSMRHNLNYLVGWTTLKGRKMKPLRKEAIKIRAEVCRMLHWL